MPRPYSGVTGEDLDRILSRGLEMSASSLSKLLETDVRVSINEFSLIPVREVAQTLGDPDHFIIGVSFKVAGEMKGHLSLLLEKPGVLSLLDVLLKRPAGTTTAIGDLERSAVEEVGNILVNAYLTPLGHELDLLVLPGPPRFSELPLGDLLESLLLDQDELAVEDQFLLMRHTLVSTNLTLDGNLVLFLKNKDTKAS